MGKRVKGLQEQSIIKDTWTITKGGWKQRREAGRARVVGWGGGKRQKTVLEQQ